MRLTALYYWPAQTPANQVDNKIAEYVKAKPEAVIQCIRQIAVHGKVNGLKHYKWKGNFKQAAQKREDYKEK